MEQIMIFLTDNSTWIFTGMSTLTLILLVVTLHKINRLSGRIKKMAQCRAEESQRTEQETKDSVTDRADIRTEQEKQAEIPKTEEASEQLIHDVIEEVFS